MSDLAIVHETKPCTKCGVEKPLDQFARHSVQNPLGKNFGRDPKCKDCKSAAARRYYRENLDAEKTRQLWRNRKHRYGITKSVYDAMFAAQGGKCAVCGNPIKHAGIGGDRKFDKAHVDHNHETGAIRGLLCGHCNNGIGHFRDNPALLRLAADYVTVRK